MRFIACLLLSLLPWMLTAQAAPTLACANAETDRVRLTWENNLSACGPFAATEVYRATDPDGPYALAAEVTDPTATEYLDPNPTGELRYYYLRHRQDCPGVTFAASDTLDSFIPRTPLIQSVSVEDGNIVIRWAESSSPEVVGYVVLEVFPTAFVPLDTVRGATQYGTLLAPGEDGSGRRFRIVAFDACGNLSPQSAILSAPILSGSGGMDCTNRITLTVDQPALANFSALSDLELFVSTNGGPFVSAGTSPPTATELRYDGANDGDNVCFYLEIGLLGIADRARSVTYCQLVDIAQPVRDFPLYGLTVDADGSLTVTYADDQVQPVPAAAVVRIDRSGVVEQADLPLPVFGTGGTLNLLPPAAPLTPGQTLAFRLTDDCDREVTTNAVAPVFLTANQFLPGTNQLSWTPLVNGLDGRIRYTVLRTDTAGNNGVVLATDLDELAYTDADGPSDEPVCYRIEATYRPDTVGLSATFSFFSNVVCLTPPTRVYVPTAFSPVSTQSTNQLFRPFFSFTPSAADYDFRVYDRWGGLRFFTNDPTSGWDGTSDGQPLDVGAYLYVLVYRNSQNRLEQRSGTINLLR